MNKQGEKNTKGSKTEEAQASAEANDINRALLLYKPVPSNKILFNYELGASWFEEVSRVTLSCVSNHTHMFTLLPFLFLLVSRILGRSPNCLFNHMF